MKSSITEIFAHAVSKSFPDEQNLPPVFLESPRQKEHGDYALNIAMVLASRLKKNPREIAQTIIDNIDDTEKAVKKTDMAGPGFINITLTEKYWREILSDIHEKGDNYGKGHIGSGEKVNIEFVSANPTGPLHVGHGRGAVVGDSLARIMTAAGYDVTREYYWNDAGNQINNLGISINYRIRELKDPDFAKKIAFPEDAYQGDYITEDVSNPDLLKKLNLDEIYSLSPEEVVNPGTMATVTSGSIGAEYIAETRVKKTLKDFGNIVFNIFQSEKELHETGLVKDTIAYLKDRGLIYEKDGAEWFRSTDFGDDKDRVVIKEDGSLTYLAADIAYHKKKLDRNYDRIIDIWGADHHGYIPRVRGAIESMGFDPERFSVLLIQMVTLTREGKPVPMSKRSGNFVTLNEVIDEVGSDAARFFFLMRRYDSQLEFDLELAKKTTADNPVFYVQYMHARICSITRNALETGLQVPCAGDVDLSLLEEPEEMDIIKQLASFPEVVEGSALAMEPHRITIYLMNLAIAFHSYYNKTRVITEDIKLSQARLYMVLAAGRVVKNALALLGISAPEKM